MAALLLVTVVLPADYGVDPTGVGRLLGLKRMGEIKVALAKEAAAARGDSPAASPAPTPAGSAAPASAPAPSNVARTDSSSHVTRVTLRPGEGKEVKLAMRKDARVNYSWSTDRGVVNYDTHAAREAAPAIPAAGDRPHRRMRPAPAVPCSPAPAATSAPRSASSSGASARRRRPTAPPPC